jgi:hypothetical protein
MAMENGLTFIEINAKDYSKVEQAFIKVSSSILAKVEGGKLPLNQVDFILFRVMVSRPAISH